MKPGLFTTEFWLALAPVFYGIAEFLKDPPTTMADAITRVAAIVAIGVSSLGYSYSRSKTKSAEMLKYHTR